MTEPRGRALMESRYGPLGCGARALTVGGVEYTLDELLFHMGLNFEDARGIDILTLGVEHYVVRYYDGQDQRIVGHEFDGEFRFLAETRAHIAEWIGDEAFFSLFSGAVRRFDDASGPE
ncbi:MAG TPA: hypothetical protein VHM88_08870 [Candidatus Acidoferrales bacterium]|nr:hypothetical protein [Candidatus Acidoferrales bacterium]